MTFLLITACLVLASSTNPAEDETRALFAKVVPELLEANDIPGAVVALVRGGEVA